MFKYSTLFLVLIVVAAVTIESSEAKKKGCKQGDRWKEDCNTCRCSKTGRATCTRQLCPPKSSGGRHRHAPLAPTCTPGKKWMEDCNECVCGKDGEPECSRRLCTARKNRRKNPSRPSKGNNQAKPANRNAASKGKGKGKGKGKKA